VKRPSHIFHPELTQGKLVRRYKRFFADVILHDETTVVAHCMNTGRMQGLLEPGSEVWIMPSDNPKRKLKWTWKIASDSETLVGVDTSLPNELVTSAIKEQYIPALRGYRAARREVKYGTNSRIDVLLSEHETDARLCYVEVKNVTLQRAGYAMFPDAVSERALKHLHELINMVREGHRAVMFFLVQRMDAQAFTPARHIHPAYAAALGEALEAGVELEAWSADVRPEGIYVHDALPFELNPDLPWQTFPVKG
jgi:sugar fermentation stimulation protein A